MAENPWKRVARELDLNNPPRPLLPAPKRKHPWWRGPFIFICVFLGAILFCMGFALLSYGP